VRNLTEQTNFLKRFGRPANGAVWNGPGKQFHNHNYPHWSMNVQRDSDADSGELLVCNHNFSDKSGGRNMPGRGSAGPLRFHCMPKSGFCKPGFLGISKIDSPAEKYLVSLPLPFRLTSICNLPATLIDTMLAMPYLMQNIRMFQYRFHPPDYRLEAS
jgi:hypothetical protein